MSEFTQFTAKTFGSLVKPYIGYFDALKLNLRKAEMPYSVEEYLSMLIFGAMLAFMFVIIFGSVFISIVTLFAAYSLTLSFIVAAGSATGVFFVGYSYPSIKAAGVAKDIDKELPFATFYMATTASSGINPSEIFKVLSRRRGRIGNEAKKIYTNVKTLGSSLTVTLQRTASRSPSPAFADLLWGMISVITAGGDLEAYLKGKTSTLMSKYRRSLNDYAKTITLFTEIYITLIIVGSLFFIILISIISPLTGVSVLLLQTFLVFFFIPLVSVGFIILLKSISPTE